jgi:hypothetical protein
VACGGVGDGPTSSSTIAELYARLEGLDAPKSISFGEQ